MSAALLEQAVALSQAGKQQEARELLVRVIAADVHNETAWLWFASTLRTREDMAKALEKCLQYNPDCHEAQKRLTVLRPGQYPQQADERKQVRRALMPGVHSAHPSPVARDRESVDTNLEVGVSGVQLAPQAAPPGGRTSARVGYVYVAINPSMADLVKIGRTQRAPEDRVKELSAATGVPTPFHLAYSELFSDCSEAEAFVQARLGSDRYAKNREFFRVPLRRAIDVILEAKRILETDHTRASTPLSAEATELLASMPTVGLDGKELTATQRMKLARYFAELKRRRPKESTATQRRMLDRDMAGERRRRRRNYLLAFCIGLAIPLCCLLLRATLPQ